MNIIETKKLGKRYIISHEAKGRYNYTTLKEVLAEGPKNLWRMITGSSALTKEEIWALRDVNLEINQAERLGIIGRNGSGKSTFLKILSRITEPTEGYAKIKSRVSSLLEVGTGFHSELTGKENIFLNGAILGMKKTEIDRRFDEIVAFSGVEKFLDTPVKRYSIGMRVRLAFAVAAHLESEILLIDEVLAVGDIEFQKKCLNKMDEISTQEGRTVLFVSHNLAAIENLCSRVILLENGRITADDSPNQVIQKYTKSISQTIAEISLADRTDRTGGDIFRFTKVEFLDTKTQQPLSAVLSGQDILVRIHYRLQNASQLDNVVMGIHFLTTEGKYLFGCSSMNTGNLFSLQDKTGYITCHIPKWPLLGQIPVFVGRGQGNIFWIR